MEVGKALRDARESKGITLETAEENTKIRRKYLDALENENYAILPGRVYIKGFIRNYAKYLGLSENDMVSAFETGSPNAEREEDKTGERLTHIEKNRTANLLKVVLGLIIIVASACFVLPHLNKTGKNVKAVPPVKTENREAENKAVQPPPQEGVQNKPLAQQGVDLTLNVTDSNCWMYVEVDGKPVYTGFLSSGQSKEFKGAEKVFFKLGNAGVVDVEFNGQKMGVLGDRGEVVSRELTASQG